MNEKSTLNVLWTMFHDLMDLVLDPSTWGGFCTESIRPWAQKTWLVKFWWSNSDFLITSFNGGFTNLLSYFFYKNLFIYLKVSAKFICPWAEKVVIVQINYYIFLSLLSLRVIVLVQMKKVEKQEMEGKWWRKKEKP